MAAFEVSLTHRIPERTTGGEVWAVGSMRNYFHTMRGLGCREYEELLPHHARSRNAELTALHVVVRYRDGTSIDHCDNVVTDIGCASY